MRVDDTRMRQRSRSPNEVRGPRGPRGVSPDRRGLYSDNRRANHRNVVYKNGSRSPECRNYENPRNYDNPRHYENARNYDNPRHYENARNYENPRHYGNARNYENPRRNFRGPRGFRGPRRRHSSDSSDDSSSEPRSVLDCAEMTFREFVMWSSDTMLPEKAIENYSRYKEEYAQHNEKEFLRKYAATEFLREKYHPLSYGKQVSQQRVRSRLSHELFLRFVDRPVSGLSLSVLSSGPRFFSDFKTDINVGENGRPVKPYYIDHPAAKSLVLENIPPHISRWTLSDFVASEAEGFSGVLMSDPRPEDTLRTAWILFDTVDHRDEAQTHFREIEAEEKMTLPGNFQIAFASPTLPASCKSHIAPPPCSLPSVIHHHYNLAVRLVRRLDELWGLHKPYVENTNENTGENCAENSSIDWIEEKIEQDSTYSEEEKLDLLIIYLRRVHNMCFYSGKLCVDEMHLWSTCGAAYIRHRHRPQNDGEKGEENEFTEEQMSEEENAWEKVLREVKEDERKWLEKLDEKLKVILQIDPFKKSTEMEKAVGEKWDAFCEEATLKCGEDEYRCDECLKRFQHPTFVYKHLKKKHINKFNLVADKLAQILIPLNFKEDPDRLVLLPTHPPTKFLPQLAQRAPLMDHPHFIDGPPRPFHTLAGPPPFELVAGRGPVIPTYNDWDQPTAAVQRPKTVERPVVVYDDL